MNNHESANNHSSSKVLWPQIRVPWSLQFKTGSYGSFHGVWCPSPSQGCPTEWFTTIRTHYYWLHTTHSPLREVPIHPVHIHGWHWDALSMSAPPHLARPSPGPNSKPPHERGSSVNPIEPLPSTSSQFPAGIQQHADNVWWSDMVSIVQSPSRLAI